MGGGCPIFLKGRLLGFVLLGMKRFQKDYTVEELELLEAFLNQTALAISGALIYRDMSLKDREIMQAEKMAAIGELAARFSDTGKGIPKEVQTKVFDPFFTTKEGGTGLGLSIAHRIITQHGGDITVEEGEEREGSTFTITLPLGTPPLGKER